MNLIAGDDVGISVFLSLEAAFEIMAKQLRDGCNDNECGR